MPSFYQALMTDENRDVGRTFVRTTVLMGTVPILLFFFVRDFLGQYIAFPGGSWLAATISAVGSIQLIGIWYTWTALRDPQVGTRLGEQDRPIGGAAGADAAAADKDDKKNQ